MTVSAPKIALVGRPNVGKSALFNCICKKRIAIVNEEEGVTRDRLYGESDLFTTPFEIIDTGGLRSEKEDVFQQGIRVQTLEAINEADALIFVVDAQVGVTHYDHDLANLLQKTKKPVCLAINKSDTGDMNEQEHAYHSLGIERQVFVSASHNSNIAELLESVLSPLTIENSFEDTEEHINTSPKVAIVGRANVGKSTLTNALLDQERCLVSPIPGTTRDAVLIPFNMDGTDYQLIDTAGIRRKRAEHAVVDKFAAIRTKNAIQDADICLLILDAADGFTTYEKKIASHIAKEKKPCIVILNKWDTVKGFRMEHCQQEIERTVPFFKYCPFLIISAKTKRGIDNIFPTVREVLVAGAEKIGTSELNKFVDYCFTRTPPPRINGKQLKVYYSTQVHKSPPAFALFVNRDDLLQGFYHQYLINQFRKKYSFLGNPISLFFKKKSERKKK
jgi:GTPase